MPRYLITYTLKSKNPDYSGIQKVFQTILRHEEGDNKPSGLLRLEESLYILHVNKSKHTLKHLAEMFEPCIGPKDQFLIARLDGKGIWHGYSANGFLENPT